MQPTASLFKRATSGIRRLKLTTKQVNGGYYKGNRTGAMGTHTKYGGYVIDWKKVRTYVVPTVEEDFQLTPFVTKKMKPTRGRYAKDEHPVMGSYYLKMWKERNGAN
ncbi:hypothetical protein FPQ18DRAFT_406253 [Pyronema domesticum]|uniref:Similar to 54S ribosomal protein L27, mitochondrial acc. no. Q5WRL1 n=1 Tax=Pyronema omphalodes (strain CBS 100304) TaxID=1076935 RepID=U4LB93_PYROM|nr:hypothetical protein FPQ18DRAFT_406253 [Pyronema domesticum]CCX07563.1 Similar to 54S ribosomal protein L27, mitochondrial; acc. no. Q5WRL1 [Pyronema omphalodes CBS 100304]